MIIEAPTIRIAGGETVVEARVGPASDGVERPGTLYFAFPAAVAEHVTTRADAFAAALLPLAMRLGEPLEVGGELSCRLAQGMRDWQHFQHTWKPSMFAEVEVRHERLSADPGPGLGAVGAAFSGGVDSFHTLLTHRRDAEPLPGFAITHALMIDGFDADAELFGGSLRTFAEVYRTMLAENGVELVLISTNLLAFLGRDVQKQAFAAFVTAPALALGRLLARFYVPSSYRFTALAGFPDGSHPMMDHLIATGTMETIHDGGHLNRVEKTLALAEWPATYDLLRVCFGATGVQSGSGAIGNCCECEKCVRTMVTLDLAGALPRFRCFPRPLTRAAIRSCNYRWAGSRVFADEIIAYARSLGRDDVVRDVRRAIFNSSVWRPAMARVFGASHALEERSRVFAAAVKAPKALVKHIGWGRGWLY